MEAEEEGATATDCRSAFEQAPEKAVRPPDDFIEQLYA